MVKPKVTQSPIGLLKKKKEEAALLCDPTLTTQLQPDQCIRRAQAARGFCGVFSYTKPPPVSPNSFPCMGKLLGSLLCVSHLPSMKFQDTWPVLTLPLFPHHHPEVGRCSNCGTEGLRHYTQSQKRSYSICRPFGGL